MKTAVETRIAAAVDVDTCDVFVIVLKPQNLLNAEVCGLKVSEWVQDVVSVYQNVCVEIKKGDDIIGIIKENTSDKKYCVVVYSDTPLLRRDSISQALSFAATYKHKVVQLPRGWVFETEHIQKDGDINAVTMPSLAEQDFMVAYNYAQVATITSYMRERINGIHMDNGVHITDPYNVYIDAKVQIGAGTRIGPGVVLRGLTEIGKACRVTNFVEIKNSKIGDNTKISHMTYIGDATVGNSCNIGCGVVVCNFDGKKKHPTKIGDNAFIGSNCNLIAPLTIGDNAFVAAGSTITQDVAPCALALARARQAVKENWRANGDDTE